MFRISPIQSVEEQIKCAKECNTEYKEGAFAYTMNDSETGAIMGFSQFEITSDGGYLHDLRPAVGYDDYEAMFILGRATMNFIDLCGAHVCRAANDAADSGLLHAIGFKEAENKVLFADMTGMFDGHCDGKHN